MHHALDLRQISAAVFFRRRADGNEHDLGGLQRSIDISSKTQALGLEVALQILLQPVLVDGGGTAVQLFYNPGVDVNANHVVAEVRQSHGCDKPYVSSADDGDSLCHNETKCAATACEFQPAQAPPDSVSVAISRMATTCTRCSSW